MYARKTEVKLTPEQELKAADIFGAARYAYNYSVAEFKRISDFNKTVEDKSQRLSFPSAYDLRKQFTRDENVPDGIRNIYSKPRFYGIKNARTALDRFFTKVSAFPRFKSRKSAKLSATFDGVLKVERHRAHIPNIGWVHIKEYGYLTPGTQKTNISSMTLSKHSGRYYLAVLYRTLVVAPVPLQGEGVGIDVGVKDLATLNDGTVFKNINKSERVRNLKKQLRREQRRFSRMEKGSNRRWKQRQRIQKLHAKIARINENHQNQVVAAVMRREPSFVAVEDLNIAGMLKNRHLARTVQEARLHQFYAKLLAKCRERGVELRRVSRWFPSTKMCASCGSTQDMPLSQRVYRCSCGHVLDRDVNAAVNIYQCVDYEVMHDPVAAYALSR